MARTPRKAITLPHLLVSAQGSRPLLTLGLNSLHGTEFVLDRQMLLLHREYPLPCRVRLWPKIDNYRGSKRSGPLSFEIQPTNQGLPVADQVLEREREQIPNWAGLPVLLQSSFHGLSTLGGIS
jgi:hypothetical protein